MVPIMNPRLDDYFSSNDRETVTLNKRLALSLFVSYKISQEITAPTKIICVKEILNVSECTDANA